MPQIVTVAQAKTPLVDPHDCTDSKEALTILGAVFDTLLTRRPEGFAPALAEAWTVSRDAMQWRFRLRPGVTFHDGSSCDAQAVVVSLKRMARADKGYTLGAPGVWHQYLGNARIVAEDVLTVSVQLEAPLADLPDILVQGFIAAPGSFAALDAGEPMWVGTGPYQLTGATAGVVETTRVEGHFGGTPEAAAVRWRAVPDMVARWEMLRAGTVQVATGLDAAGPPRAGYAGVTCHKALDPVAIIFLLNAAKGPLAHAQVRRALSLAVDRGDVITRVMGGAAHALHGVVSPVHFGAGDAPVPCDPQQAQALLAKAGFAEGLRLTVDCPTALPDEAEALTAELGRQLAKVGITLDVTRHEDREAYAHMVRRKEIGDMCVFDSSPLSTFRVLYEKIDSRVAGSWWQGYRNPAVETLLDRARRDVQADRREATFREIYRFLQDDPPWLTLYNPMQIIGMSGSIGRFDARLDGVLDVRVLPGFG